MNKLKGKRVARIEESTSPDTSPIEDQIKIHFMDGSYLEVTSYGGAYCTSSLGWDLHEPK